MKYKIIDNFISADNCKKLINFSENLNNDKEGISYHVNRSEIFSTYNSFHKTINNQKETKELNNYLFSKKFFDFACEKLSIESSDFKLVKYYNLQKFNTLSENRKNVSLIPDDQLLKIYILRKIRQLKSKIIFNNFLNKKKKVELLYGFSKAGNGYNQAIHRDSDSRLIVFLLYLNDIPANANGGNLDLYKKIGKITEIENPSENSLEKITSIAPKEGRLVIFKNDDDSYHGVKTMKNYINYRHFIYGAFTILNDKCPFISNKEIPTEFFLY